MYEYVFYKIYKASYDDQYPKWSEWRAGVILVILEIWFIFSLIVYYKVFINRYFNLPDNAIVWGLLGAITLGLLLYYSFWSKDKYKEIVTRYDAWPKRKNVIGTVIVWVIIFAIVTSLILAFYFMSRIDWSLYR